MIYVKPSISALRQPLRKRLPTLDQADPQISRRSRGKRHYHGDDVCGGSCVCVDGTLCPIPTVGNLRSGSFLLPPESFLLPPELFRTQIVVKLLIIRCSSFNYVALLHSLLAIVSVHQSWEWGTIAAMVQRWPP
jgi:hypothetical protein